MSDRPPCSRRNDCGCPSGWRRPLRQGARPPRGPVRSRRGCCRALPGRFPGQQGGRQLLQLVVEQRQQLTGRVNFAAVRARKVKTVAARPTTPNKDQMDPWGRGEGDGSSVLPWWRSQASLRRRDGQENGPAGLPLPGLAAKAAQLWWLSAGELRAAVRSTEASNRPDTHLPARLKPHQARPDPVQARDRAKAASCGTATEGSSKEEAGRGSRELFMKGVESECLSAEPGVGPSIQSPPGEQVDFGVLGGRFLDKRLIGGNQRDAVNLRDGEVQTVLKGMTGLDGAFDGLVQAHRPPGSVCK
jgi:hypothetical protein